MYIDSDIEICLDNNYSKEYIEFLHVTDCENISYIIVEYLYDCGYTHRHIFWEDISNVYNSYITHTIDKNTNSQLVLDLMYIFIRSNLGNVTLNSVKKFIHNINIV